MERSICGLHSKEKQKLIRKQLNPKRIDFDESPPLKGRMRKKTKDTFVSVTHSVEFRQR